MAEHSTAADPLAHGEATVLVPTLHHVNLKTVRLREMIDWYTTVVGMQVYYEYEGGAWLSNDAANHRLALLTSPAMADDPEKIVHTGIHHSAFEFGGSVDDLLGTYERLRKRGIVPHACLDHGMTTSFYYVDPDGNSVELQVDNFGGDWSKGTEFVRDSPDFAANPIGTALDPDRMVVARRAGMSPEELHRRGRAGEFRPADPLDLRLP
jgi:catechol 2,3-dioxygenase